MADFTKVSTMDTSSGVPTPPFPTPRTVAASDIDSIPETDLTAVSASLEPIKEDLNETAEEAAVPSPPVNTPAFSPAPSVAGRYLSKTGRGRGLSTVADRLAAITLERGTGSASGDKESVASGEDLGNSQSIWVALGSPNKNPRIEEYLTFTGTGSASPDKKQDREKDKEDREQEGVVEKSNWAEEVMSDLERAVKRLEQLADDEATANEMAADDCYVARLQKVLGGERVWPVAVKKIE